MLELRDLKIIQQIAEHGSLARAARAMGLGQPAVSRLLAAMERRLRGPLFERSRLGVQPTDLCRVALANGAEILARMDLLNAQLSNTRGGQRQDLAIIAGHYVAETIGVVAAARLLAALPAVQLRLVAADWPQVPRAVRAREAEAGLMDLRELGEAGDLLVEPLTPQPGVFVVRAGHALLAEADLDLPAILAWPLIFLDQTPHRVKKPMAEAREAVARSRRPHPAFPALILANPLAQIRAVLHSDAVAAVTLPVAQTWLDLGELVVLPWRAPWVSVHYGIIRLRGRPPSAALETYLDLLRMADAEARAAASRGLALLGLSDATG